MKQIKLTQGKFAMVDDEDFDYLNQWKWYAFRNYARRRDGTKKVFMHRQILGESCVGLLVDHKDGDGLNNQRHNLRTATHYQNVVNRKPSKSSSSKFLGVSWNTKNKNWTAMIKKNGEHIHLGCFNYEEDAAKAYNIAATELHGEFASINEVDMSVAPVRNKKGWHIKFRSK